MKRAVAIAGTWLGVGAVFGVLAFAGICFVFDRERARDGKV